VKTHILTTREKGEKKEGCIWKKGQKNSKFINQNTRVSKKTEKKAAI
jgi:hypothetical protein